MIWTNLNQGEDQLLLFHHAARGGRLEADVEMFTFKLLLILSSLAHVLLALATLLDSTAVRVSLGRT